MIIRDERPGDVEAIDALTQLAFAPMPFGDGTEAPIIRQLRADGDLTLSLVALKDDEIVGHVAFSPAKIGNAPGLRFGLGPISVTPDLQKQGIGSALIKTGLERLRAMNALECVLIGNPAVYGPMGFVSDGSLTYGSLDPKLVQRCLINGAPTGGEVRFASAFDMDQTGT